MVGGVAREQDGDVLEGLLHCSGPACQREYPVLEGIPFLLANGGAFVAENVLPLLARDDLSALLATHVGDCCGPGSLYDAVRQHVSTYAWDHYGDLDPAEEVPLDPGAPRSGATRGLLERAFQAAGLAPDQPLPAGPVLDLGAGVGRTSFTLAGRTRDLVVGADLHVSMLRLASRVLRRREVRYARRRVGLVYDERAFPAAFEGAERVDFWACDAAALPFRPGTFALAVSLNLLDCMHAPLAHLRELARVLAPGAAALLASPYDWSSSATPFNHWLGGHSQRGGHQGDSAAILRALLTPGGHPQSIAGLELEAEVERVPWQARTHERAAMRYEAHVVVARRSEA